MLRVDELVDNHKVFVDTCSLMHERADDVFKSTLPVALKKSDSRLIVPLRVKQELERLRSHKKQQTRTAAKKASRLFDELQRKKLVEVRGEDSDPFADNVFQYVFSKFRTKHNLALITQDVALAKDIDRLRESQSVQSRFRIALLKISRQGNLVEWRITNNGKVCSEKRDKTREAFRVYKTPVKCDDEPIAGVKVPGTGDRISVDGGQSLRIMEEVAAGGEGRIYRTSDSGKVCKIYHKKMLTSYRQAKLELMVRNKIARKGICWPAEIALNRKRQFVGYTMPEAKGVPLQRSIFLKPLFEREFPSWTRTDLVDLAISIVEMVDFLHGHNVLIGDINPMNVLVAGSKEVYWVDTDSFQIERYPCPVGMVNYTAPEIQGKAFDSFLRTAQHEYFALATLIFMILVPGKPPYSHQGGGEPSANIMTRAFPYPLGEQKTGQAPQGPWRFIWSNLTYKMKEAFWRVFAENARYSPREWIPLLRGYRHALEQGYNVSDELFPKTFKKVSEHAQKEYGAEDIFEAMECDECHCEFSVPKDKAKDWIYCKNCFEAARKRQADGKTKTCADCGEIFLFTFGEQEFYAEKGLKPPTRCKDCRGTRKGQRGAAGGKKRKEEETTIWSILSGIWKSL